MKHDPVALKISDQYIILLKCIEKEELCFKVIRKSSLSALKKKLDKLRDSLVIGMKGALNAALRHIDENIRAAAERLIIVFNTYNRPKAIQSLSYDEETVIINNMLDEMETNYASDIEITGLKEWVKGLRVQNDAFEQLTVDYNVQQAEKPSFRSEEVRKETEKAYHDIVSIIDAAMIKEGNTAYAPFVAELNTLIKHNNDLLAQHLGRNKAKKQTEEEKLKEEEAKKQEEAKSKEEEAKKQDETKQGDTKQESGKTDDDKTEDTK
jgi:hypothetical protein